MSKQPDSARRHAIRQATDYLAAMLEDPKAFRGQQLRGSGAVAAFESALAVRCGFPYCLATCNATTALLVAALAAELPGKQIIVPPNSWGGTYGPFEFVGAELEEADADEHGNISPASVVELASRFTGAVIAADWRSVRHSAEDVRMACDSVDCLYIEDTGWLPGITAPVNELSLADVQVISFGPGKPLSLGEGGALLTRHRHIYERAIALSQHPERSFSEGLMATSPRPFLNGRIHQIAAVIGCALLSD